MKRVLLTTILVMTGFAIILSSCNNNGGHTVPDMSAEFRNFLNNLKENNPDEMFVLNPLIDNRLVTEKGSVLLFPANSFIDSSGHPLASGSVFIQLKELNSRGGIIMENSSTMTDAYNLLESGGQMKITARDASGNMLQTVNYHVSFNADPTEDYMSKSMGLFKGVEDDSTGFVRWVDEPLVDDTVKASLDSIGTGTGFFYSFFDVSSLGWINLDRFADGEGMYDVSVGMDMPGLSPTNTIVYFIFDEMMSVSTLDAFDPDTEKFSNLFYRFPAGYHVKFLAMSKVDGVIYYALTGNYLLDNHLNVTLEMEIISEAGLTDLLSAL